jgi:hypothetical protein
VAKIADPAPLFAVNLDVGRTFSETSCVIPLDDAEIVATAKSAWKYQTTGQNRIGQHRVWFPTAEAVPSPSPTALLVVSLVEARPQGGTVGSLGCPGCVRAGIKERRLAALNGRRLRGRGG